MQSKRQLYFLLFSQIFAGMGIGVLMGLIIGLSASPVVKTILGSLSGLLAVFLGLQDNIFGKSSNAEASSPIVLASFRAGSFGLFCALSILYGLHLRTHDTIGLSVTDQVKKWTDAGYDTTLARELALFEKIDMTSKQLLNLQLQKSDTAAGAENAPRKGGLASTVLFSAENLTKLASLINPDTYDRSASNTLRNYKMMGEPVIDAYAVAVERNFTSEESRYAILKAVTELTKVLITGENEYRSLKSVGTDYEAIRNWARKNNHTEMLEVTTLVEQNVPLNERDEFMKTVADLLFKLKFDNE